MTRPRRSEGTSHAPPGAPQASRRTPVSRSLDEDTLRDASPSATEVSPVGFVCPPCGRFVRTDLDGVLLPDLSGRLSECLGPSFKPKTHFEHHNLCRISCSWIVREKYAALPRTIAWSVLQLGPDVG